MSKVTKKNKTKLEIEKENRKKLHEWAERIDELGQENEEKGIKAVQDFQKEEDQKLEAEKNAEFEKIERARRFTDDEYKAALCGWGAVVLHGIKLPKNCWIKAVPTKKDQKFGKFYAQDGILLCISTPKGFYAKGIALSYIPEFDMRGVEDKMMEAIDYCDILMEPEGPQKDNGRTLHQ